MSECTCVTRCGGIVCRLESWRYERTQPCCQFKEVATKIIEQLEPVCRKPLPEPPGEQP
jgi:hypothetical protein